MEKWRTELYHHGIKGMKWGIRRTPEQLGHKRASNRRVPKKEPVVKNGKKRVARVLLAIGGVSIVALGAKYAYSKTHPAKMSDEDIIRELDKIVELFGDIFDDDE